MPHGDFPEEADMDWDSPVPPEVLARMTPPQSPPPPLVGEMPPFLGMLVPENDYPSLYRSEGEPRHGRDD